MQKCITLLSFAKFKINLIVSSHLASDLWAKPDLKRSSGPRSFASISTPISQFQTLEFCNSAGVLYIHGGQVLMLTEHRAQTTDPFLVQTNPIPRVGYSPLRSSLHPDPSSSSIFASEILAQREDYLQRTLNGPRQGLGMFLE